jgi:glutamyl-tRNA synthetase
MRGIKSHAMVLCASNADHTVVEFLQPPAGSQPGERVTFAGHPGEPEALLNPKKKVWETVQPDFTTTAGERVAVWRDVPFATARGVVTAPTLEGASIK